MQRGTGSRCRVARSGFGFGACHLRFVLAALFALQVEPQSSQIARPFLTRTTRLLWPQPPHGVDTIIATATMSMPWKSAGNAMG
jgi:hypothetical protein